MRRARLVALVALLIGAPAWVLFSLVGAPAPLGARPGDQPGGRLSGHVASEDGAPLGDVTVELWRGVPAGPGVARAASPTFERLAATQSDAGGAFALEAPPCRGFYTVGAGGGVWQRSWQPLSLLDRDGARREPGPIELRLRPGVRLQVTVDAPVAGAASGEGRYALHRTGGWLASLLGRPPERSGEFRGRSFALDALAPGDYRLEVALDSGETFSRALELLAGERTVSL